LPGLGAVGHRVAVMAQIAQRYLGDEPGGGVVVGEEDAQSAGVGGATVERSARRGFPIQHIVLIGGTRPKPSARRKGPSWEPGHYDARAWAAKAERIRPSSASTASMSSRPGSRGPAPP